MRKNMYGEPLPRREWLRPKWYVADFGEGWVGGSASPTSMTISDETEDPDCTDCGISLGDHYWSLPSGPSCADCRVVRWPPVRTPAWKRKTLWPLSSAVDRLYWWHCHRFGKRVVL